MSLNPSVWTSASDNTVHYNTAYYIVANIVKSFNLSDWPDSGRQHYDLPSYKWVVANTFRSSGPVKEASKIFAEARSSGLLFPEAQLQGNTQETTPPEPEEKPASFVTLDEFDTFVLAHKKKMSAIEQTQMSIIADIKLNHETIRGFHESFGDTLQSLNAQVAELNTMYNQVQELQNQVQELHEQVKSITDFITGHGFKINAKHE